MSEYQYYEFLAVDRPLDATQLAEVRALSTRARITATGFVNSYEWGDFRGDPRTLMERHYDAHLYVTNWGTHQVMLRLPERLLDLATAEQYLLDDWVDVWARGSSVLLDLRSEDEGGDWDEYAEDSLAAIAGVRAELADGDLRSLYLAWLSALGAWELQDDAEEEYQSTPEPPVPPGLSSLTAPQRALADFLRVDPDLLAVAAQSSAALLAPAVSERDLARWIEALAEPEKDELLLRVACGQHAGVRAELLRRHRGSSGEPAGTDAPRRSAAELLDAAAAHRIARRRASAGPSRAVDGADPADGADVVDGVAGHGEEVGVVARGDASLAVPQPARSGREGRD